MTQSNKDDDTITINLDDFTFDSMDNQYTVSSLDDISTITFDANVHSNTVDISTLVDLDPTFTLDVGGSEVFVHKMPDLHRVKDMCEYYPALAKAFENFKTIYKMTEQDYKGILKSKGLDDDIPF